MYYYYYNPIMKKMMDSKRSTLKKYTTIPVLFDILARKRIALLDPKKWEDRNDWKIMEQYRKKKNKKSILATCFCYGNESIYHWNAFSKEEDGCMIAFDFGKFINHVADNYPDVYMGVVQYKYLKELNENFKLDEIPFTKRKQYACEKEFRFIQLFDEETTSFDIAFDHSFIKKIVLTQKMPTCISETLKKKIAAFGIPAKKIEVSSILENKKWVDFFENFRDSE